MSGPAGGTKSSPWAKDSEGGTLGANILEGLEEEITILEGMDTIDPAKLGSQQTRPPIAMVGFKGETQTQRPPPKPPDRADTEEVDPRTGKKRESWEDIIAAAESPALERWGQQRGPEGSTNVPLTEARPKAPPSVLPRRPLVPEKKDHVPVAPAVVPLQGVLAGPRGMPRVQQEAKTIPTPPQARPAVTPNQATIQARAVPGGTPPKTPIVEPKIPTGARPIPQAPSQRPIPTAPLTSRPVATNLPSMPEHRPMVARAPVAPSSTRPAPAPSAPLPKAPASPSFTRPPLPQAPGARATDPLSAPPPMAPRPPPPPTKAERPAAPSLAPPAAKATTKAPAPVPSKIGPAALPTTDDLLITQRGDSSLEDPPNEHTHLGELAGRHLTAQPVVGAPKGAVPAALTIAAPGELAGMLPPLSLTNPPVRHVPTPIVAELSGVADDLSLPMAPISHSQVERGLMAPLATPETSSMLPPPPRPLSLALERDESSLENIPLPTPPPIMRGAHLTQASTLPLPHEGVEETARLDPPAILGGRVELAIAPGWRRWLAVSLDAALLVGITGGLAFIGFFGDLVGQLKPDPDTIARVISSGEMNLPAGFILVLMLLYSATSHATIGRSLGKLITGLEVVARSTGKRPGVLRAIWRSITSVFSLLFLGAGYFWVILDRKRRGFHDLLSGTVVVVTRSRKETAPLTPEEPPASFVPEPTL